jgi:hypothetical protein
MTPNPDTRERMKAAWEASHGWAWTGSVPAERTAAEMFDAGFACAERRVQELEEALTAERRAANVFRREASALRGDDARKFARAVLEAARER